MKNPTKTTLEIETNEKMLSYQLIQAQTTLRQSAKNNQSRGILLLVNGMENASKGQAVTFLSNLMDARHLKVHATMGQHPSQFQPIWQRHSQHLPKQGEVTIYFGNWYADLIRQIFDKNHVLSAKEINKILTNLMNFEQDLTNNGIEIIKCWFTVDKKTLKNRLTDDLPDPEQLYHIDWHNTKDVKKFIQFSEILLNNQNDWHQIDGTDTEIANLQFAQLVLHHLQNQPNSLEILSTKFQQAPIPNILIQPKTEKLDKITYKKQLKDKQKQLVKLLRQRGQRHLILLFEGMDASGKGGSIKRLVQNLDPREFTIYPISAPTDVEESYPYLWRFWTRLPHDELADVNIYDVLQQHSHKNLIKQLQNNQRDSRVVIFDRSWYGRVLVERVEKFATPQEWQRAYDEINRFEQDLIENQAIICKFWLAISEQEQLKRFEERQNNPNKQHKITAEDWRNRKKWADYVQAVADMLAWTDKPHAQWHIIATDDKYTARLQVLDSLIEQLKQQLST